MQLSAEVAPSAVISPVGQSEQAALEAPSEYVPTGQIVHEASPKPGRHSVQISAAVAPAPTVVELPGQAVQGEVAGCSVSL